MCLRWKMCFDWGIQSAEVSTCIELSHAHMKFTASFFAFDFQVGTSPLRYLRLLEVRPSIGHSYCLGICYWPVRKLRSWVKGCCCGWWWFSHSYRIHVWYIYLHLAKIYGKCRQNYHTWILWDLKARSQVPSASIRGKRKHGKAGQIYGNFSKPYLVRPLPWVFFLGSNHTWPPGGCIDLRMNFCVWWFVCFMILPFGCVFWEHWHCVVFWHSLVIQR